MKRVWSFLLAAALVLGLAVTGFAGGTPVGTSNYLEYAGQQTPAGGTFTDSSSVNDGDAQDPNGWTSPSNLKLISSQKPASVAATLEGGKRIAAALESTLEQEPGVFSTQISLRFYNDYTVEEVGQSFAGTLSFTMEDGSTITFQLENKVTARPNWNLSFFDKNGNRVSAYRLKLGETYTVRASVRDDTDVLRQEFGVKQISARWRVENGNGEVAVLRGSESLEVTGEWIEDETVYTMDYSGEKPTEFPFRLVFTTKTIGKFDVGFEFYYDTDTHSGGAVTYYPEIVDISNIVSPGAIEEAIENPDSEGIVIDIPKNMGLNENSFESIWEKANGQPVTLNANGAKLTFDTSEPLPAEFLRDLANRNDSFFDPSVYSRIPQKAQDAGYHGGRWMEFMYSGVLPGKMTVTVDIPQNTFPAGTALRLWYYDTVTGRASLDPTTVTLDGSEATFSITHCSAYALYPAGYDPNPAVPRSRTINPMTSPAAAAPPPPVPARATRKKPLAGRICARKSAPPNRAIRCASPFRRMKRFPPACCAR